MKFDVVYPLVSPASLKVKVFPQTDATTCSFFHGTRLFVSIPVRAYGGSRAGETVVAPLPVKVLNLRTCEIVSGVFTLTPRSGKRKNSLRFTATLEEPGKPDQKIDTVLIRW